MNIIYHKIPVFNDINYLSFGIAVAMYYSMNIKNKTNKLLTLNSTCVNIIGERKETMKNLIKLIGYQVELVSTLIVLSVFVIGLLTSI